MVRRFIPMTRGLVERLAKTYGAHWPELRLVADAMLPTGVREPKPSCPPATSLTSPISGTLTSTNAI